MKRVAFMVGLACVISLLVPIAAQTPPPANFISVISIQVRPGAFMEFEDYVKKVHAAGLKMGVKVRVDAYQVVQGGSPFRYDMVSAFATLAELAAAPNTGMIVNKVYGEVEGGKILRTGRATIESMESTVLRLLPDYSTKARGIMGAPFVQLTQTEIDPQVAGEYNQYLAKLKAAGDKSPAAPTALRHINTFGPSFQYLTAQPFNTWAEREQWPESQEALNAAYDQGEVMKLFDVSRRATKSRNISVVAFRRDLSRIPAGTTN